MSEPVHAHAIGYYIEGRSSLNGLDVGLDTMLPWRTQDVRLRSRDFQAIKGTRKVQVLVVAALFVRCAQSCRSVALTLAKVPRLGDRPHLTLALVDTDAQCVRWTVLWPSVGSISLNCSLCHSRN